MPITKLRDLTCDEIGLCGGTYPDCAVGHAARTCERAEVTLPDERIFSVTTCPVVGVADGAAVVQIAKNVTLEIGNARRLRRMSDELAGTNARLVATVDRLKTTQAQLLQAEKLSAIGQLVAGVAHELNNPLTSVIGYAQLVENELRSASPEATVRPTAALARDLRRIAEESERAARIVRNLLAFARRQTAERAPQDIVDLVGRVLALRAYEFRLSGIELDTEYEPNLPRVLADAGQLQQALLNLVLNAEQAMRGRTPRRLRIGARYVEEVCGRRALGRRHGSWHLRGQHPSRSSTRSSRRATSAKGRASASASATAFCAITAGRSASRAGSASAPLSRSCCRRALDATGRARPRSARRPQRAERARLRRGHAGRLGAQCAVADGGDAAAQLPAGRFDAAFIDPAGIGGRHRRVAQRAAHRRGADRDRVDDEHGRRRAVERLEAGGAGGPDATVRLAGAASGAPGSFEGVCMTGQQPLLVVIDDEQGILDVVSRFARRAGYEVVTCSGGREAIGLLQTRRADLVLVDLRMPDVGGLDVLRAIRDIDPRCQAILMTGYASVDTAVDAIKLGAMDYLSKPIDFARLEQLLISVKEEIERRTQPADDRKRPGAPARVLRHGRRGPGRCRSSSG